MIIFAEIIIEMKTLISWLALDYDFIPAEKTVSHRSPNVNVHKDGTIKYDRHILLSTDKELSAGTIALANAIRTEASYCEVVPKALNISDAYNFQTIIEKLDAVLKEHNIQEADILFSNGTTVMRIAWYILSSESGFQLRLIQGVIKQEDPFIGNFPAIRFSRAIPGKLTVKQGKESYSSIPKPKEKVYALAKKIAEVDDITVLINGDSGTGKEWLAKYIHNNSARSNCKFIAVNCSALSDNLLESRLFGYKKGAFTDAKDDKKGFF